MKGEGWMVRGRGVGKWGERVVSVPGGWVEVWLL